MEILLNFKVWLVSFFSFFIYWSAACLERRLSYHKRSLWRKLNTFTPVLKPQWHQLSVQSRSCVVQNNLFLSSFSHSKINDLVYFTFIGKHCQKTDWASMCCVCKLWLSLHSCCCFWIMTASITREQEEEEACWSGEFWLTWSLFTEAVWAQWWSQKPTNSPWVVLIDALWRQS